MIRLTKRDGSPLFINPDLIETIEETPDTHLALVNGHRYLVCENAQEILNRIVEFRAIVLRRSTHITPRRLRKWRGQERPGTS